MQSVSAQELPVKEPKLSPVDAENVLERQARNRLPSSSSGKSHSSDTAVPEEAGAD